MWPPLRILNALMKCSFKNKRLSFKYTRIPLKESLLSLNRRHPKAVMVTNREHIPSSRTANQRDVVRNKNQASGYTHRRDVSVSLEKVHEIGAIMWITTSTSVFQTWVQILMGIKGSLEPFLSFEGTDGPKTLEWGRQVGKHRASSCRGNNSLTSYTDTCIRTTHTIGHNRQLKATHSWIQDVWHHVRSAESSAAGTGRL